MSTETDAQLNALKEEIAAVRQENEKAWTLARDCYNALVNAKTVGTNGKLGALSGADTLSGAPVGDAAAARKSLGLGGLATYDTPAFFSIDVDCIEMYGSPSFIDMHRGRDGKDYEVRLVCESEKTIRCTGRFETDELILTAGEYAVGSTILAANFSGYNVLWGWISDGTNLCPCSTNGWMDNKNLRLTGRWKCVSQCAADFNKEGASAIGLWRRVL